MNNRFIKRLFDLMAAVPSVIILFPFLAIIGFLVRMRIGSPVLFRQMRPGLHGRPFTIYKFCTMTDELDEDGNLLPDGARLTRLGRFLRKTSLDEMPELFNVIKGNMSIAGPRPLLMQYLECYTPEQMRRHEVKPGITGWAQVNGRNGFLVPVRDAKVLAERMECFIKHPELIARMGGEEQADSG